MRILTTKSRVTFINTVLITLTFVSSSPGLSHQYGEAADHARRALLEMKTVKEATKKLERKTIDGFEDFTGMTKEDLIYFAWAVPVVSGRISTKPFRNLKMDIGDGVIRPEVEYRFSGESTAFLRYNMEF